MASGGGPSLLEQADELYGQQKYGEVLELLEPGSAESEDAELLWRLMRLYYRLGKEAAKGDQTKAGELAKKAYETSERGLKINDKSFGIQKVKKKVHKCSLCVSVLHFSLSVVKFSLFTIIFPLVSCPAPLMHARERVWSKGSH